MLRRFLEQIERQYGKARRLWLMDRDVPIEELLAEMLQPALGAWRYLAAVTGNIRCSYFVPGNMTYG